VFISDHSFIRDVGLKLELEDYEKANTLISSPFGFYGGHLQMTAQGKDDFLKDQATKKLVYYFKQMQLDRAALIEDKTAVE